MKRLCAGLLAMLLLALCACEQAEQEDIFDGEVVNEATGPGSWEVTMERIDLSTAEQEDISDGEVVNEATGPGAWKVTMERIDLSTAEGMQYATEFKRQWIKPYQKSEKVNESDPWTYVYGTQESYRHGKVEEKSRPWGEAELVIAYTAIGEWESKTEMFVRDKSTGKTQLIAEGYDSDVNGVVYTILEFLSETHLLYDYSDLDGDWGNYFLYDRKTEKSIRLPIEYPLGDLRYLGRDWEEDEGRSIILTDARKLAAGEKDAKRVITRLRDGFNGYVQDVQGDYIFLSLSKKSGRSSIAYRGIYDINTGEELAFFQLPNMRWHSGDAVSQTMEYLYCCGHDIFPCYTCDQYAYVIRYDPKSRPKATASEPSRVDQANKQWKVTVEEIDLGLPENKQYVDWLKAKLAERRSNPYKWMPMDKEPEACAIEWMEVQGYNLRNLRRDWGEAREIVIEYSDITEENPKFAFYVREKATGKTQTITQGEGIHALGPAVYNIEKILDDENLLYSFYGEGVKTYYIYNRASGESTYMASEAVELSDTELLQIEWDGVDCVTLIDAYKFAAGDKDAKRIVVRLDGDYSGYISHVSRDKRFVHVNHRNNSDGTNHRGVYDIETGKQVAFFPLPERFYDDVEVISDNLEYIYDTYNWEKGYFGVILYER